MRRYLILAFLFCLTLPFDLAVTGCYRNPAANFCENIGYGTSNTGISSITLGPATTGISLPYGEIGTPTAPAAKSCTNATVSVSAYQYGTSDMTIADINPATGSICAGTWNRTTAGGVAAYTTCLPTGKTGVANITASAGTVTSNVVPVYVHPQIGSVVLTTTPSSTTTSNDGNQCVSQGQTATLDITAYAAGASTPLCAPKSATLPECSAVLGALTYTPVTAAVVTLGTTLGTTNIATANQPGSTAITASTNTGNTTGGTTTSAAGYFYTCPPATISLTANGVACTNAAAGTNCVNVTPNNPQAITATVTDVNKNVITGLTLTYASTQPENVPVSSAGSISSVFPGTASVTAICQPPTCNPAPINEIGINGTGTPVVSNPLLVNSTGTSSTILYMSSPKSDFFSAIDFTIGSVTTPVKMPYTPNSMILDPTGTNLYFGSYRELMVFSASSNSLTKQDTTVPGVVLAVSPNDTTLLINDQNRGILYLYGTAGSSTSGTTTGTGTTTTGTSTATASGIITTYGGVGQHAQFSSDGNTVYIVGNNNLYIHNVFTGWSTVPLNAGTGVNNQVTAATSLATACAASITSNSVQGSSLGGGNDANAQYNTFCSPDIALAIPTVGPFVTGTPTSESLGFCPNLENNPTVYYPAAGTLGAATDHLTATTNSEHVIGAVAGTSPQITDSFTDIPTGACPLTTLAGLATPVSSPLKIGNPSNKATVLTGYNISSIDQVVASTDSTLAFVTYQGTGTAGSAKLPAYKIPTTGTDGVLVPVALSGTSTAPIAGVFSPDTKTFYVSTSGDNLVHLVSTSLLTDTSTLAPGLPDASGNITPAQFLAVKARTQP